MKSMSVLKNKIMRKTAVISALLIFLNFCSCSESQQESSSANNADISGEWYSGEIGGSFCFDDDNKFSLKVDLTDTMYIDENNTAHITGSDEDYSDSCRFDGKTYSFEVNGVDMITMTRDESSESAFGQYTLKSGILYNELSESYGDLQDRYKIIAGKDELTAQIYMCEYSVNDKIITFSGDDLSFFGAEKGTVSIFNFAVENNVLTLVGENSTLVFSKVR